MIEREHWNVAARALNSVYWEHVKAFDTEDEARELVQKGLDEGMYEIMISKVITHSEIVTRGNDE